MHKPTQKELIQGCRNKEAHYQKALVVQYSPILMTVSRRYAPDMASAKDVLQMSLVKILNSIGQYKETGKLEAWMKRIVINTALTTFRKRKVQFESIEGYELDKNTAIHPEVYSKLEVEELMKVIDSLPEGFREVFNLYAIEGFSHKEIGELLGIKEATSRSQLARARTLLKKKLQLSEKLDYGI